MALTLVRPKGAHPWCHVTSREAMLFMKYEHFGKCKGSFKDSQRKCKYDKLAITMTHQYIFCALFKKKKTEIVIACKNIVPFVF